MKNIQISWFPYLFLWALSGPGTSSYLRPYGTHPLHQGHLNMGRDLACQIYSMLVPKPDRIHEAPVRACKKLSQNFQKFLSENEPGKIQTWSQKSVSCQNSDSGKNPAPCWEFSDQRLRESKGRVAISAHPHLSTTMRQVGRDRKIWLSVLNLVGC